MAAFDRPMTAGSLWHRRCGLSPRENSQLESGTKLLKRVWKAVVVAELVVLAGVLIFVFAHYFSYDVFVSNLSTFHHQATAAQPR